MSNGARHGLGILVGFIFTPLIISALLYGTQKLNTSFRLFAGGDSDRWLAAGALAFAAVLIGFLAGSRVSPVASLIPGALLTAVGALWVAVPRSMIRHTAGELPDDLDRGYQILSSTGLLLVLGVLLLVAGLLPSRWRALQSSARVSGQSPYLPPGQQGQQGLPRPAPAFPGPGQQQPAHQQQGPPPFDPSARPYPQGPPPAPAQAPPAPAPPAQAPPPQPQPQPQPQQQAQPPAQPPPKPATEEEAGEWTRMYGGDDFKGSR